MVTYLEEFSSILIAISNSDASAVDADIEANSEVGRLEGRVRAILFQNHLSLQESSLGSTTVSLLRLDDHNGVILQVVQNDKFSDSVVF